MPRPDSELRSRDLAQMIAELTITEEQPTSWTTFSSRLITMQDSLFIGDVEWSWAVLDPITGQPAVPMRRPPPSEAPPPGSLARSGSVDYISDHTIQGGSVTLGIASPMEPSTAPIVVVRSDPLDPTTEQRLGLTHTARSGPPTMIWASNTSPPAGDPVTITWMLAPAGGTTQVFYFDSGADMPLTPVQVASGSYVDPGAAAGTYRTYVVEVESADGLVTSRVVAVRWGLTQGPNVQVTVPDINPLPGESVEISWMSDRPVVVIVEGDPVVPVAPSTTFEVFLGRMEVDLPPPPVPPDPPMQAVPRVERLVGRVVVGDLVGEVDEPQAREMFVGRAVVENPLGRVWVEDRVGRISVEVMIGRMVVENLLGAIPVEVLLGAVPVEVFLVRRSVEVVLGIILIGELVGRVGVEALIARTPVDVVLGRVSVGVRVGRVGVEAFIDRVSVEVNLGQVWRDNFVGRLMVDQRVGSVEVEAFIGRVPVEVQLGQIALQLLLSDFTVPTGHTVQTLALLEAGASPTAFSQSPFAASGQLLDGDLTFLPTGSTLVRIRNTAVTPTLNFSGGSSVGAYLQAAEGQTIVAWYQRRGELFSQNLYNSAGGIGFTALTLFTSGVPTWLAQLTVGERFIVAYTLPGP